MQNSDFFRNLNCTRNDEYEEKIYDVIRQVIQTPGLIIGRKSLHELNSFLGGFSFAFMVFYNYFPHFFREFQDYIEQKYHYTGSLAWDAIISVGKSEDEAFDCFVELFDKFVDEK